MTEPPHKGDKIEEKEKDMAKKSFMSLFWEYAKVRKRYLLVPIIVLLVLFILVLVLTKGSSIGQFIYSFF